MKYKNLQQLAAAFASGELDKTKYKLILDNDCSFLNYVGPLPAGMNPDTEEADIWRDEQHEKAHKLFEGNGYRDLLDACLAAGIPADWC
jgi:hypothetical protein